jgi:hypothetical protein
MIRSPIGALGIGRLLPKLRRVDRSGPHGSTRSLRHRPPGRQGRRSPGFVRGAHPCVQVASLFLVGAGKALSSRRSLLIFLAPLSPPEYRPVIVAIMRRDRTRPPILPRANGSTAAQGAVPIVGRLPLDGP